MVQTGQDRGVVLPGIKVDQGVAVPADRTLWHSGRFRELWFKLDQLKESS